MRAKRTPWLQRDLELRLMLPMLVIVTLAGLLGAYSADNLVEEVFDRWLLDAGYSLAEQVSFEGDTAAVKLSSAAQALLIYDAFDRVNFQVRQGNHVLIGPADLPQSGTIKTSRDGVVIYNAFFESLPIRVVKIQVNGPAGQSAQVLMAETLLKRERARRALLFMMIPLALLPLIAVFAIGVAVRSTIRPLQHIAARWNERSTNSLQPLSLEKIPKELLPFASALNGLLDRLRSTLERERELAAITAHQLRTPLAGLQLGLARASEAKDLESMREVLHDMSRTTARTARLVQQLLALGRLDPEVRVELNFSKVDLAALVLTVGESYLDSALDKGVMLEFTAEPALVSALAQPELIGEAVANLVDNAIGYTPAGGRVVISVIAEQGSANVSVCDSGPGMAVDQRERMFDRFVRGHGLQRDGSGLGLAIAREIATIHGGKVWLEESPLGGICARLTLPVPRIINATV